MKKKLIFLISSVLIMISASFSAFAGSIGAASPEEFTFSLSALLKGFSSCVSAIIGAVLCLAAVILLAVFRNKLKKKLDGSSSGAMLTAFIILFSVCTAACLVLALLTEGESWSGMMHIDTSGDYIFTQFSDYIASMRSAGSKRFEEIAPYFSPLSSVIFLILAQFVPSKYILDTTSLTMASMMKNQAVMLLYLFLVLFTVVSLYKMNRMVLSKNPHTRKVDIILLLLLFSYPAIYCIELGNIAGISLVFTMFFVLFRNNDKKLMHEIALALLSVSVAITPYTLIFVLLLLFSDKSKISKILDIGKVLLYSLVLFIVPAIFTGFGNARVYLGSLLGISAGMFIPGNTSIANLLLFFGVRNSILLQIITVLINLIAFACIFMLKPQWQKATAIVYIILNIFGASAPHIYLFIFIPLMLLLAEEKHDFKDWLYLISYSFLILPIPTWYYFEQENFTSFLNAFGLDYIPAANSLFATAAVQMLLVLMCLQITGELQKRKELKA